MQPNVADVMLEDDRLIQVAPAGRIAWEWVASDHIDELGFAADARKAIKVAGTFNSARGSFDWLHVNSATYVGPNRWFDQGDRRFAPNNVLNVILTAPGQSSTVLCQTGLGRCANSTRTQLTGGTVVTQAGPTAAHSGPLTRVLRPCRG
jgi:hypothetical protein